MKPRIRFQRDFFCPSGQWCCSDGSRSGFGRTPAEAYANWLSPWAYIGVSA